MQNITGHCQQTFCFQKFDDNAQQCFAFTPQANFPAHNLIFSEGKSDGIESRLPFKIFSTLSCYLYEGADAPIKHKVVQESLTLFPLLVRCCAPS